VADIEKESVKEREAKELERDFNLLSSADRGEELTVRDDQYDFPWLLDAIKLCRKRGSRFRLIDTGVFDLSQMEWIAKEGADLYTSDEAKRDLENLKFIHRITRKSGVIMGYFCYGDLGKEGNSSLFSELKTLGTMGFYIYLTNTEKERDFAQLNELASHCQMGGTWLVYYHYGPFSDAMVELASHGAWIHIADRSLQQEGSGDLLMKAIKSSRSAGTNIVIHLEKGLDISLLRRIVKAKAIVILKSFPKDYHSPLKDLERMIKIRNLDFRAYYLYKTFLP